MFAFFVTLFGGLYLLIRTAIDKNQDYESERKFKTAEATKRAFMNKYCVSNHEWWKLTHWFEDPDEREQNWFSVEFAELRGKLEKIIGVEPTWQMTYYAYIALTGKIPPNISLNDIKRPSSSPLSDGIGFYGGDYEWRYTPKELGWFRVKFLQWYDEELRKNGMEYRLMMHNTNELGWISNSKWVGDLQNGIDNPVQMVAFWEPLALHLSY